MVYAKTLKALRQKGLGLYTFYKRNYYRLSILLCDIVASSLPCDLSAVRCRTCPQICPRFRSIMATAIYLYITLMASETVHFLFRLCVGQYRPCRFHKLLQKQHFLECGHKSPETVEAQSFQGFDGHTKVGYFLFDPHPHIWPFDKAQLMRRVLQCDIHS